MRLLTLVRRSAAQSWHVLAGSIFLLGGVQVVLVAQAVAIEESQAFGRMAEFLPSFLQRGLGQQALLLATYQGTIAFGYFHPVFVVAIGLVAAYFTTEPAYDVEAGRVDLVLARSVPRHRLITRSAVLGAGAVIAIAAAMALGTWLGLAVYANGRFAPPPATTILRLIAHLTAVAWCFGAFGLAVGAGARRWSTAFAFVIMISVLMYWIDFAAIAWEPARKIAWISPYDYYPAIPILAGTAPAWTNLAVLWVTTLVLWGVAYWRFERRDL